MRRLFDPFYIEGNFPSKVGTFKNIIDQGITIAPITLNKINRKLTGRILSLNSNLSSIRTPVDKKVNALVCPECGRVYGQYKNSKSYYFVKSDGAEEEHTMLFCDECAHSYRIPDTLYSSKDIFALDELYEETIYYTEQILKFEDKNWGKTLYCLYISENNPLPQSKKGQTYNIIGPLYYHNIDEEYVMVTDIITEINSTEPDYYEETPDKSRDIPGYDEWRKHVLSRDKKCVVCGGDKNLHAHHLFGYKENPSLRVHTENGVAVCEWCHNKYHAYYGVKQINPVDFIKFIQKFGVKQ